MRAAPIKKTVTPETSGGKRRWMARGGRKERAISSTDPTATVPR